jgi:hypothetical protein
LATWLTHLRIAERIKERIPGISLPYLMIGSIAPDSGTPDEQQTTYNPPKELTHFKTTIHGNKNKIDLEAFYNKYLAPPKIINRSDKTRSFLWGYYFHLIADSYWIENYLNPLQKEYDHKLEQEDKDFMDIMREETYALDFEFLKKTEYELLNKFKDIKVDINFFNEFEPSHIKKCQARIVIYYEQKQNPDISSNKFYKEETLEQFITEAAKLCVEKLL